jgi:hypothetical protein
LVDISGLTGASPGGTGVLTNTSQGIKWVAGKSFVIDHPEKQDKYLVHACLEGPEAGVYYRGKALMKDTKVTIELPEYASQVATNFTVQVTAIGKSPKRLTVSEVENNKFKVYGDEGNYPFFWTVIGERISFDAEPNKQLFDLKGDGPYTYLVSK